MKKARDIIRDLISTKQYNMSIKIMELFSQYRAYTGHDISASKVINDLHITPHIFNNIVAGSTEIDPKKYEIMIKYLDKECKSVNPKYTSVAYVIGINTSVQYEGLPQYIVDSFNKIVSNVKGNKRTKKVSKYEKILSYKHAINL